MTTDRVPIEFFDEDRTRWTVTRRPVSPAGVVLLDFVSEVGQRRTCLVIPIAEEAWAGLADRAWQALVRVASPQ